MQFIQVFLLVVSTLLIVYIAQYSFSHRKTPGAFAFFILVIATLIWSAGSLLELYSTSLPDKVFWRNVQQLGVFSLPISSVYFAVIYTRKTQYLRYVYWATIPSVVSVVLIFTNEFHHLMRTGYALKASTVYGNTLVITPTILNSALVSYNFVLPLAAIVLLYMFTRKVSPRFRKQTFIIACCFLYTVTIAWVKMAILEPKGIYIEISVLNMPSALIMFLSLFKYQTFTLAPIARDKVFSVISQGILVMDAEGTIIDVNNFALQSMDEYFHIHNPLGAKMSNINKRYPEINQLIGVQSETQVEIATLHNGEKVYITLSYYPLFHNTDTYIGSVIILNNITNQKQQENTLKERAERDYLTNFFNKFGFEKALQKQLQRNKLSQYAVLMIDVDNFKQINDTFGHAAGDAILCNFTNIVSRYIRSEDIAGRLGGDEFVIVLPCILEKTAYQIAERIRNAVEASKITIGQELTHYTISIGITANHSKEDTFDAALARADKALYTAKRNSRNCSVIYSEEFE